MPACSRAHTPQHKKPVNCNKKPCGTQLEKARVPQ